MRKQGKKSRLLSAYEKLTVEGQASLCDFAEFLLERHPATPAAQPQEPQYEAPPENERVIAAIKRLSRVYPMIDKSELLHETSDLVTQHMMQGRQAEDVIEELERLFLSRYQTQRADNQ